MHAYIVQRILATIPVMAVVALFVFGLLHLTPGDPAAVIAGELATVDDIARIRAQLGLDQPIHLQFLTWLGQLLQGDLGTSIFSKLPVSHLIAQRLEPTLMLSLATIVFAVTFAVPMGVIAAWRAGTLDRPRGDGLRRARLLDPGVRARLPLHLRLRGPAALAAGAGLQADRRRLLAVPAEHRAAEPDARRDLHRADRADHPRERARGAERGLHPHRARQGARHAARCCSATRSRPPRCRSSRSSASAWRC